MLKPTHPERLLRRTRARQGSSPGPSPGFALVAASAESSAPIEQAASLWHHKGRVVLVGMTEMDLDRRTFNDKEASAREWAPADMSYFAKRREEE